MRTRELLSIAKSEALDLAGRVGHFFVKKGFDEAAEICLSTLSKSIDDLSKKDKTDKRLSDKEHFLYVRLSELKREMEERLADSRASGLADREDS